MDKMNRKWNFVKYKCDLPQIEGWYYVIDAAGAEYKDYFYADTHKFAINSKIKMIKLWSECEVQYE